MARILGVGVATLDIINYVEHYPEPDQEVRANARRMSCGGNASNTLMVLSDLGHQVALAAVLARDHESDLICQALQDHHIDISPCVRMSGRSPVSCVLVAADSASRTIVHYRDLPELPASALTGMDLDGFDWLHFEGRNIDQTREMMAHVRENCPATVISLELEKPRPGIETLLPYANLVLYSGTFVRSQSATPGEQWLKSRHQQDDHAIQVCSDAEQGAWACDRQGKLYYSPAWVPGRVVDTLGAGDVFNAAFINAMLKSRSLQNALEQACKMAGEKCARQEIVTQS